VKLFQIFFTANQFLVVFKNNQLEAPVGHWFDGEGVVVGEWEDGHGKDINYLGLDINLNASLIVKSTLSSLPEFTTSKVTGLHVQKVKSISASTHQ